VLIRKGIHFSRELLDPDGRLISIDVGSFTFINLYAPSGQIAREERNIFLRQTIPAYAVSTNLPLLLVGDFNCVDEALDPVRNIQLRGLALILKLLALAHISAS
jgi:exonuclease III